MLVLASGGSARPRVGNCWGLPLPLRCLGDAADAIHERLRACDHAPYGSSRLDLRVCPVASHSRWHCAGVAYCSATRSRLQPDGSPQASRAFADEHTPSSTTYATARSFHCSVDSMARSAGANERLEVLGDELRAIVADDPWPRLGERLAPALQDNLHVSFLHRFANLPMNDVSAKAVQHTAQVVKRATDVDVRHVHMPVLVGTDRLIETGSLLRGLAVP